MTWGRDPHSQPRPAQVPACCPGYRSPFSLLLATRCFLPVKEPLPTVLY